MGKSCLNGSSLHLEYERRWGWFNHGIIKQEEGTKELFEEFQNRDILGIGLRRVFEKGFVESRISFLSQMDVKDFEFFHF